MPDSLPSLLRIMMASAVMLLSAVLPASAGNPAVVFDGKTGEMIFAEDAGQPWYPASLTKIMTAYVVFEAISAGKISLTTMGTVTKTSSAPPPSKIGFKPGQKVGVDFALQALLVYSANDMAALLAETVAGSQERFVVMMNEAAHKLGMTGTNFVNPHGLHDPKQVTTARDMAILTYALINRYPQARKYYSAPFVVSGKKKLRNRNYLLRIWDKADGLKTGFICPSGFNLVASANINGRSIIGVVFGTRSGKARAHKAKVLMENAALYKGGTPITALRNLGATPPNMRQTVCGGKGLQMVNADDFSGWGATYGKFKSAAEAEAVFNGMQVAKAANLQGSGGGVVRIPFTKDYVPVSFRLDQTMSQRVCQEVHAAGGVCEVVSPAVFASFANLAGRESAGGTAPANAGGTTSAKQQPRKKKERRRSDK